MKRIHPKKSFLFCLFFILGALSWGVEAVDVYIIVDGSTAMERGKEEALSWLCTRIDGLNQGDRVWIWRAGTRPELIYSDTLGDNREQIKTLVRSIKFQGDTTDYWSALKAAQDLSNKHSGRLAYALLVSGSGAKSPPRKAESSGPLQYSRVDSFSGWRVLTVGLGLAPRVRQSSNYYMNSQ